MYQCESPRKLAYLPNSCSLKAHEQGWKLKYVTENLDHLLRLTANSTLREELTAFPLAKDTADCIATEQRLGRIPYTHLYQ